MRAKIDNQVLFIHKEDVPPFKKNGPIVRNNYFWALRSIADRSYRDKDWEFDETVWIALARMLLSFSESGYLGLSETTLEFAPDDTIPADLKPIASWAVPEDDADRA
ncbi:MAG: hypothetical protein AAFU71_16510 [Cyanobacteria bacterium J06632_22]